jgi:hypothetical protein
LEGDGTKICALEDGEVVFSEEEIVGKEVVIMLGSEEQRRGRDERAEARRLRG